MAIEYFCCYHSYLRKLAKLSDQEVGRLFRALLTYSATGEPQELAGRESVAYDFIVDDIDRAKEAYEAKCQKNRENRLSTTVNDGQRPSTAVTKTKTKTKSKSNFNDKDDDTRTRESDGLVHVMTEYMELIEPTPSPTSMELLEHYVGTLGAEVCLRAIYRAIDTGVRKWTYIKKILQGCEKDGIKCLADWDRLEEGRNGTRNPAGGNAAGSSRKTRDWGLDTLKL